MSFHVTDPLLSQAKKPNFDPSHELEELLLEDNPLKAKARKVNQDNLSAEMKQMEDQYVSREKSCAFLARYSPSAT